MEFVHTARELRLYTIRKCASFPKRYTFYISQPMTECATKIRALVTRANDIYPTHRHQAQMRADYLLLARGELHNLISQIEEADELFGIEPDSMRFWMELVDREIRLVSGAMKRDAERYKKLPL